jgi:dihydrofolate reductase
MAKVVLFMAMSLDGFIAGPDDSVGQPAGRGGERLFAWSDHEATSKAVHAEYDATGAVLAGRRTYDLVDGRRLFDHLGGDHIELELIHLREAPQATHLRYRIVG